jgi:uncharacterized protein (TIGR02646 family)
MIPVSPQPEPPEFDAKVRQKGAAWIKKKKLNPNEPLPKSVKYPKKPYWTAQKDGFDCLEELYHRYSMVCAYTGFFMSIGAKSVDHFIAKSRHVGLAFEWSNYRLACKSINGTKADFELLLDPFLITPETFFLILATGEIYVNPNARDIESAQKTIEILKLDKQQYRDIRFKYYSDYKKGKYTKDYLLEIAPFVYLEAQRQNLL